MSPRPSSGLASVLARNNLRCTKAECIPEAQQYSKGLDTQLSFPSFFLRLYFLSDLLAPLNSRGGMDYRRFLGLRYKSSSPRSKFTLMAMVLRGLLLVFRFGHTAGADMHHLRLGWVLAPLSIFSFTLYLIWRQGRFAQCLRAGILVLRSRPFWTCFFAAFFLYRYKSLRDALFFAGTVSRVVLLYLKLVPKTEGLSNIATLQSIITQFTSLNVTLIGA